MGWLRSVPDGAMDSLYDHEHICSAVKWGW